MGGGGGGGGVDGGRTGKVDNDYISDILSVQSSS